MSAQFTLIEAMAVPTIPVQAFHVARLDDTPVLPVAIVTTLPDHAPAFSLTARRG